MVHGWELVENFLFTDAEAAVRHRLTLDVLELKGDVQAPRMEVRRSLVVVEVLIHLGHLLVSLETVTCLLVTPVELTLLQGLTDEDQLLGSLLKALLHLLVQLLLLDKLVTWLDLRWRSLISQVEEVNISLHETVSKQLNADIHLIFPLLKLEAPILPNLVLVHDARDGGFLGFLALSAVLFDDLRLCGRDQLIFLLCLRFLHDLPDACVWVEDWLVFHLVFLLSK